MQWNSFSARMSRLLEGIDNNFIGMEAANKSDNGEMSFCDTRKTASTVQSAKTK